MTQQVGNRCLAGDPAGGQQVTAGENPIRSPPSKKLAKLVNTGQNWSKTGEPRPENWRRPGEKLVRNWWRAKRLS